MKILELNKTGIYAAPSAERLAVELDTIVLESSPTGETYDDQLTYPGF